MRILLTGGSGFVGQAVLKVLNKQQNLEIEVVSRGGSEEGFSQLGIRAHEFDYIKESVYQQELLSNFDVLVHCAWEGLPRKSSHLNYSNVKASTKLFKNFVKFGGQKIISIGSCLEYGTAVGEVSEEFSGVNVEGFGLAKRNLLSCLNDLDCDYAWLRPFFLYGPNQHANSLLKTSINKRFETGHEWLNEPTKKNDFTYVEDVANLILEILESNSYVKELNIGSSVSRRNIDFVNLVRRNLGYTPLEFGVGSTEGMVSCNSKLLKHFPKFLITELEDGLNKTLTCYKEGWK